MTFPRALEPTNPWGLSELEFAVMGSYAQLGDCTDVAKALKTPKRGVEDALQRVRRKMGVATNAQQVALWATWRTERKYTGPRSVWICTHCEGRGFVSKAPE